MIVARARKTRPAIQRVSVIPIHTPLTMVPLRVALTRIARALPVDVTRRVAIALTVDRAVDTRPSEVAGTDVGFDALSSLPTVHSVAHGCARESVSLPAGVALALDLARTV